MANIYLTLNLKEKFLADDEDKFLFEFNHWDYNLDTRVFELDDLAIDYDLINDFVFKPTITTDKAYIEIEDGEILRLDIYNKYDDYLKSDLETSIEDFISDKDLSDGDYQVKYTYYYDFSNEEFIIEIVEVVNE